MASTKDIHDIMGMGGGPVQKPANKKKKKIVETQPRLSGISREVQALMGDSVPPVQIVDTPKYKSKPILASKLYKPRHWNEREFTPGARADGLVLRHWKRALPLQRPLPTNGDVDMADDEKETSRPGNQFEDEFPMERWDVRIKVPEYTDELYDRHFKTDDWTREETDYLMRITADYDLRWHLIADRYDPLEIQPPSTDADGMDVAKSYVPRTMEQLKLRYYQVAAQDLELKTPKSTMNPSEFALWEKMRSFDAKTEGLRKTMAEKLFERTKDEAEEERTLLEELHRITKNEEDFINLRRDLYARLEAAPSLRRNERGEEQNIVLSSAGLSDLLSRLFAKEKHLKRRVPAPGEQGPAQQHAIEARGRSNTTASKRETLDTPNESNKKGSVSHQPQQKQLTKEQEEKFGVSHPTEKLTSGVSFRHEKINRITTAKSQVQTQKVIQALNELQIPARLSMPTEKVCKEFERLVGQIQILLDCRKTLGRVSEEVKILEEMRRQRLGEPVAVEPTSGDAAKATEQTQPGSSEAVVAGSGEDPPSTREDEGEPGPAVDEDEDDAEGEDDVEVSQIDHTKVEEDDEQDETKINDDSMVQKEVDEDEEEDEAEDDEDEDADEQDDEDDDEGTAALRRGADNDDDEDADEDEDDDHPEPLVEEDDDGEGDDEDEAVSAHVSANNGAGSDDGEEDEEEEEEEEEDDDDDDDDDEEDEEEDPEKDVTMDEVEPSGGDPDVDNSRPASAGSRAHKRGASVVSEASGAGSNRSALGRKRKR